ncbi:MAG: peptidase MA family metallohydrolase [Candidatus Marinimicrobia bacterium]|nr:peptidase MA family metallohydrolase [Candidatus Neomarinimicrobiota bacterium]
MKIKNFYFIILLFSLLFAVPDKQLEMDNIHVYYAEKDARIAQISLEIVQKQQLRLRDQYKLDINPIHIYIADNKDIYRQYSGTSSPVWSVGLASDDKMLVKSPSFSRQNLNDFQKTLLHETAHLAVSGIPLPVWFNEGFAQYEAGQFDLHKRILVSRAFWRQDLMWAHEIEYLMQINRGKAEIAYAQSVAMVDYLINYFGVELVGKCLLFSKEYQNFEKGFKNAFLMDPDKFEKHWREKTKDRYRFYILLDQNNLIWILSPILLIIGFILTKTRRRYLLKKWEQEELENDSLSTEGKNIEN